MNLKQSMYSRSRIYRIYFSKRLRHFILDKLHKLYNIEYLLFILNNSVFCNLLRDFFGLKQFASESFITSGSARKRSVGEAACQQQSGRTSFYEPK